MDFSWLDFFKTMLLLSGWMSAHYFYRRLHSHILALRGLMYLYTKVCKEHGIEPEKYIELHSE